MRNLVERLVVISDSNIIDISRDSIVKPMQDTAAALHSTGIPDEKAIPEDAFIYSHPDTVEQDYSLPFKEALKKFEQDYVNHVLARCGGNVSKAAKELGLHRSSLYNILHR